jgi:hypothetical protein
MKYIHVFLFLALVQGLHGQRPEPEYKIGDIVCNGIVFYVETDSTGRQHGLVCAVSDQHEGIPWYNKGYKITKANHDGLFAKNNADLIIREQGEGEYAASICDAIDTSGCDNYWYLPSREELLFIYKNIANNSDNIIKRKGNFKNEGYWSSIEESHGSKSSNKRKAYIVDFYDGRLFPVNKSNKYRVRAVREFWN